MIKTKTVRANSISTCYFSFDEIMDFLISLNKKGEIPVANYFEKLSNFADTCIIDNE